MEILRSVTDKIISFWLATYDMISPTGILCETWISNGGSLLFKDFNSVEMEIGLRVAFKVSSNRFIKIREER